MACRLVRVGLALLASLAGCHRSTTPLAGACGPAGCPGACDVFHPCAAGLACLSDGTCHQIRCASDGDCPAGTRCCGGSCSAPRPIEVRASSTVRNQVDVLFMVDNSNSMAAMSEELKTRFDQFFKVYQQLAKNGVYLDLHVGVVTSDYGAGATGAPGCQPSPGGQQGMLQAIGQFATQDCKPIRGGNFLSYAFQPGGTPISNLPVGQDLLQTFTCMASVGAMGCGFEHQLESVYAALHNNLPENAGFLRDGAVLTVVFLTNEDDGSAPPDATLFDKSLVPQYGYESSYRQTHFGIVCGAGPGPMTLPPYDDSMGPLLNCRPAPNLDNAGPGLEYDVSRYIDFFTQPSSLGGVKADPNDVILVGIDAPEAPVQVILSNPGTPGGQPYIPCGALNELSSPPCVPVSQHSCQNPEQPVFFGDPAVRLNAVIRAAPHHAIRSICDSDYSSALQLTSSLVVSQVGIGCLPDGVTDLAACTAADRTVDGNGAAQTTTLPRCEDAGPARPCWKVEAKTGCAGVSKGGLGFTIDRGGAGTPAQTDSVLACPAQAC